VFDSIGQPFSESSRCTSVIAIVTLSNEEDRENAPYSYGEKEAMFDIIKHV